MATTRPTPAEACARAALHTPCPEGIVQWQSWAAAMYASGHRQSRCPACGRYAIWRGTKAMVPVAEHETVCLNARGRRGVPGAPGAPADERED